MEIFEIAEMLGANINYESLLQTFFKDYPDAIWIKVKNLKLLSANSAFYEHFNKSADCCNSSGEMQILQEKRTVTFSIHSEKKNQVLAVTAMPVLNNNSVECILYISKDITEQEELKERFFVNKYQLNALLENIPKIIYMQDLNGQYITGTKHSKAFFNDGFDYFHKIQLDFQSINATKMCEDKSVIENNKLITYDKEIVDTRGIPHWYTIYKAPINDYHNNVIGILVMAKNIDDEKHLQAQRETFVASLGHDLKNPTLAQIRAVELLLKGEFGSLTEEQQEILGMLLDSCKYMNAMLSSLLATYRNERGVVKLNYEEVSLTDLAEDCIGEMIYIAKDKNVNISIEKRCDIPFVYGDKVQIKRVIMNLLSNGIKYAFKDTEIKIKIYNEINLTCFSLENRSPYIPAEKREAIFAQYVSFAEAHKELGIGLGLYTSKKIVNAHAGSIFVESYEDERTIFGFKIPNVKDSICAAKTVSF